MELVKQDLINDQEMPVKVEAAIALQTLVSNQEHGQSHTHTHAFMFSPKVQVSETVRK